MTARFVVIAGAVVAALAPAQVSAAARLAGADVRIVFESPVACTVEPGDLLYVPAGWFHQVRALEFSLSSNRWARGVPLALQDDPSVRP